MKWKLKNANEAIGQRFGRLVVNEVTDKRINRHVVVKCKCDCGGEGMFDLSQIKAGRINSCGCLKKEASVRHLQIAHELQFNNGSWSREPRIGSAINIYRDRYDDGDLSFEEFLELSQKNCYYCGIEPFCVSNAYSYYSRRFESYKEERIRDGYFTYNGLDRIDSSLPHNKNNVVTCCYPCNIAKLDFSQEEFFTSTKRRYLYLLKNNLI